MTTPVRSRVALCIILLTWSSAHADGWRPDKAGKHLDQRQQAWFRSAQCISCHTGLPYALARPALRKLAAETTASEPESKMLGQVKRRVAHWQELDSKAFGLYYDANDVLKKQSWGTEAVFNAAILAFNDRYEGRAAPSPETKTAFANLWKTQLRSGPYKGSWEWLDFNEAPWGNSEARYVGAALAAVAVGAAPGERRKEAGIELLRGYLRDQFPKQNLHNQIWGLWAASNIDGVLSPSERTKLINLLLGMQRQDGGWSLTALGKWIRNDGTAQDTKSDGYATAIVVHVLQTAGAPKIDARIAKGLTWLERHQMATGAWSSVSLVKKRDPASHTGKFMSDAATAFAVLALSD